MVDETYSEEFWCTKKRTDKATSREYPRESKSQSKGHHRMDPVQSMMKLGE